MTNNTVICTDLNKAFAGVPVVRDLSLRVEQGHILALLGPSGCGKTTTLRLIAGFEQLDSGRIEIAGQLVADPGESRGFHLPPEKRRVGMVFQDYAIFPHLDVAANVAFGLGRGRSAEARTQTMLELVGLAGLGPQMPYELSGGQQQRVALARALAPEPAVLLLDEPFSNLDTSLRVQVRREVRHLLKQTGATAVFVTHDQEEALFIGDDVAVMNEGRLEQLGTPYDIFHRPQTRFVAEFMGQTDFVPGRVTAGGVETPLGLIAGRVQGLDSSAAVQVALRPDDVALTAANDEANGRIVERRFVGIANIYLVALSDGSLVHSWQPHTVEFAPGAAVRVSLRPGHPVSCFDNSQRLEIRD
jgi:iron(III) transport system ATP-binding protein